MTGKFWWLSFLIVAEISYSLKHVIVEHQGDDISVFLGVKK